MDPTKTLREALLWCGVAAPLLWVGADVVAAQLCPGYSFISQAPSELSAIGAPTRQLLTATGVAYDLLVLLFGFGVGMSARGRRALRVAAFLLIGAGVVLGIGWYLSPMHQRGAQPTASDTMHLVMAALTVSTMLLYIGFGAAGLGPVFRLYSAATIAVVLGFGLLTARYVDAVAAQQPTPWLGVVERVGVYAGMVWMLFFSVALRRQGRRAESWPLARTPEPAV